ncbi:MAG: amidohydrolase/deacetylase family metallohydrolase [bacterium]
MAEFNYDILLKGGRVIDPANNIFSDMDVGIKDRKIKQVASDIPSDQSAKVIDVSGHYVVPGIIDIHTHVYTGWPSSVNADAHLFSSGVTTTVDAGSAGWMNFPHFKETCIDKSRVRIFAFLNIASGGMVLGETEQNPKEMSPEITAAVVDTYPNIIVGIKSAHYWTNKPWDSEHPPWASVENAVKAGILCNKPVMVDFWPRPPERPYPDLILKKLRPGDIHTHVFAQQFPIINNNGKVYDYMFEARERGVIFDLGHGAGSFWFRNAVPALEDGFPPDSISTDLHMGNINGPVVSMLNTMSKYLSMGMPIEDVIRISTVTPAKEIGHPELGNLSIGSGADIAIIKQLDGIFSFADCGRAKLTGKKKLECILTIRNGDIVYDPTGLSMPEWKDAPASYWVIPSLQS